MKRQTLLKKRGLSLQGLVLKKIKGHLEEFLCLQYAYSQGRGPNL